MPCGESFDVALVLHLREIIEPYLVQAGLYTVPDPTYGRWDLPAHPPHKTLLEDPEVSHRYRRVYLRPQSSFGSSAEYHDSTEIIHAEDVDLKPNELGQGVSRGGRWVFYIVFEMSNPPAEGWQEDGRGKGRDLVLIHGERFSCAL